MLQRATLVIVLISLVSVGLCIWPEPQSSSYGTQTILLNPDYTSIRTSTPTNIIRDAIFRYSSLFFPYEHKNDVKQPFEVNITCGTDTNLQFPMDEHYTLNIKGQSCQINATSVWGALRGLETLSQLITYNSQAQHYQIENTPVSITDFPRFPWRGLLIDTSRHYLPPSAILGTIDAMSYAKLNTLHWHIYDDQSFPVASKTFPNLTLGAYDPDAIYTHDDIQEIINFAKLRGIRVVPEFEMPGHFGGWQAAFPNIVTPSCAGNPPINPTVSATWIVISAFLHEMSLLFPDSYFHMGGDEVDTGCWDDNAQIQAWMKANNIKNSKGLMQYFENRLLNQVLPQNAPTKHMVVWEDLFDNGVTFPSAKNVIIEVWRSTKELAAVVAAGYRGLLAAGFYLDQQIPNSAQTFYEWEDTWINFYENEPITKELKEMKENNPELDLGLVIGGEACMWGEQVDQTNIFSRIWPRAAGTAEKLWSSEKNGKATPAVRARLAKWRCSSLAVRGINAGPVEPDFCRIPSRR